MQLASKVICLWLCDNWLSLVKCTMTCFQISCASQRFFRKKHNNNIILYYYYHTLRSINWQGAVEQKQINTHTFHELLPPRLFQQHDQHYVLAFYFYVPYRTNEKYVNSLKKKRTSTLTFLPQQKCFVSSIIALSQQSEQRCKKNPTPSSSKWLKQKDQNSCEQISSNRIEILSKKYTGFLLLLLKKEKKSNEKPWPLV
jgi:hypothetical protein